jgi:hypothetical protein
MTQQKLGVPSQFTPRKNLLQTAFLQAARHSGKISRMTASAQSFSISTCWRAIRKFQGLPRGGSLADCELPA